MFEYIRQRKIDTNECPNKYLWSIYSNIQIFESIRHTPARPGHFPVIHFLHLGLGAAFIQDVKAPSLQTLLNFYDKPKISAFAFTNVFFPSKSVEVLAGMEME